MPRKRKTANVAEQKMGVQGLTGSVSASALDYFTNLAARTGFGTPSLAEGANYELVRFSYDYWQLITMYRNHWISRRIVDTPAQDMVKAWPTITGDTKPKDIDKLDKCLRRTQTKINLLTALKWAKLFGGAGCLIAIDGHEHDLDQELKLDDIEIGAYKGLIPFDRWAGINPDGDVCTDIKRPVDFNRPDYYTVRPTGGDSFRVHASRVLRFCGPEVPTPEREAQSWWGISVLEPAYEEIRKRDNMSWNILALTFRANILGFKMPELAAMLSGVGSTQAATQKFTERMEKFNELLSNQSIALIPKDGDLQSVSYSFAGLSECYQQFQLDISGAAQIPVTRLWGRTISGLGQSNDADERIYEERIATDQDTDMRPQLEKLYPIMCASELGDVPDDMDLNFPSVRVLDEKEKSELAKTVVDTVTVALNSGGISPRTYAKELKQSSKVTGIFTNITDEQIEALSDDVQPEGEMGGDLFGEEGGEPNLEPASGPQRVLKEEGKEKKGKAADALPSGITMKRGANFQFEGVYDVTLNGKTFKIFRSTDDGWWYEDKAGHFTQNLLGFNKTEALEALAKKYGGAKATDADGRAEGSTTVHGLTCVIETGKGGICEGKDWAVKLAADYGYIQGYRGNDGDSLDCYVGQESNGWVYVVDQRHIPGIGKGFDEHKVLMNFPNSNSALDAYRRSHHRAVDVMMDWTPMPVSEFKTWISKPDNLTRPCGGVLQ